MGKCIIKLKEWYFEWSTIVDAPTTTRMTLKDLKEHIRHIYGANGIKELPDRLERVEKTGTSMFGTTAELMIECNRAGENESELTEDEIIEQYKV